jgi:DNA-binding transcriptional LysR family regulator
MQPADDAPSLELLRCFAALHRERHLSRAAARRGLSQPAMSRALARLRAMFGDPLFVRTPRGMLPTTRAEALAPRVQAVVEAAAALVRPPEFDPARLVCTFTIATAGFSESQFLPPLVATLAREAPGVSIALRPIGRSIAEQLESGVDLIVTVRDALPGEARRVLIHEETFTCAVRRDHPAVGKRLTLDRYVELSHLVVSPGVNPGSVVDSALARLGRARRVVVRVHTFPIAPSVIAGSDLVLTAPMHTLAAMAPPYRLRLLPPPVELASFGVYLAWHPRVHHDPASVWFRGKLLAATRR